MFCKAFEKREKIADIFSSRVFAVNWILGSTKLDWNYFKLTQKRFFYFQDLIFEMFCRNKFKILSLWEGIISKILFWQSLLTFRIFQNSLSFPPGPCVKRVTEIFSSLPISARPSLHHEDLQGCFLRWVPD